MAVGRVVLYACGGVRQPGATVARIANYVVDEELVPGKVMILCAPALLCGVEEDVAMVERNPTIVVDGCADNCGVHLLQLLGITPAARLALPEFAAARDLSPGLGRRSLDADGRALARAAAEMLAALVRGMLKDPEYRYRRQQVQRQGRRLCDPAEAVDIAQDYVLVAPGLYRPRAMPALALERTGALTAGGS